MLRRLIYLKLPTNRRAVTSGYNDPPWNKCSWMKRRSVAQCVHESLLSRGKNETQHHSNQF
eukprot:5903575-Lingulodinium_polyedra.AAC.1